MKKYETLFSILYQKASSLPAGSKLPSIRSLMKRYGYSLQTVNSALNMLFREGVIEKKRGSGIYTCRKKDIKYIEVHFPRFINSILDVKEYSVGNAISKEGWSLAIRHHHPTLDDPMDTPDSSASAHVISPELANLNRSFYRIITEQKVPIVLMGRHENVKLDMIMHDDSKLLHQMLSFLIERDHKKILFVKNEPAHIDSERRSAIFFEKTSLLGFESAQLMDCETQRGELSSLKAYEKFKRYLKELHTNKSPLPFSVILTLSASGAKGIIRALFEAGISVPEQCSVCTLGIEAESGLFIPNITSIGIDASAYGSAVVEILKRRFNGEKVAPIHHELDIHLLVRESTATAPNKPVYVRYRKVA